MVRRSPHTSLSLSLPPHSHICVFSFSFVGAEVASLPTDVCRHLWSLSLSVSLSPPLPTSSHHTHTHTHTHPLPPSSLPLSLFLQAIRHAVRLPLLPASPGCSPSLPPQSRCATMSAAEAVSPPVSPATPVSPPASPAMGPVSPAALATFAIGMDIGSVTTRVAVLNPARPMPTIVRNALGNEATSTVVSFAANEARSFGENAAARQVTKASETIVDLAPWIFGYSCGEQAPKDSTASLQLVSPATAMTDAVTLTSRQLGTQTSLTHPAQVAAFYIKSLLRFLPDEEVLRTAPLCLSVPSAASAASFEALRQATLLAGVPPERTLIAHSDEATAVYFHHLQYSSLPDTHENGAAVPVVLIDIGQSCSVASLIIASKPRVEKVCCQTLRMGSEYMDALLCSHVYDELERKFGTAAAEPLRGDVKSFRKILRECRKAKEVLSTTDETRVQLEGLRGDIDIVVPVTRAMMEQAAQPFLQAVRAMLVAIKERMPARVAQAGEAEAEAAAGTPAATPRVEVIGGGWRSVCVLEVIKDVFGISRAGVSLDANLSVAEGSAILAQVRRLSLARQQAGVSGEAAAAAVAASAPETSTIAAAHHVTLVGFEVLDASSPICRPLSDAGAAAAAEWVELERQMEESDARIHERLAALNELDSYILQSLTAVDKCTASSGRKTEMRAYLEEVDMYVRNEGDEAGTEELRGKLAEVEAHVGQHFAELAAYYEDLRQEQRRKEEELTQLSKERQEDESELKSDPQRLRMAQRRREQGQGLFKEECWAEAQTRFVQALSILGQLYDTSSDENKAAKQEISLSCYLNIASCSVKLGLWRNAVNNCTHALEMAPSHAKALFRRGQAYAALKEYKEAVADLESAKTASRDDPAVVAELTAARAALEAAKAKEKKLFSRMFS
ncbi:Hsp70 protein/TPR repeat/Tetratricopeptide repeat [Novymonas esmeraldas]|uniref:Hsp70 protein/TPR repeat/Tetratricopeptide repeat n=1 Tax=Novymonas esmeraldas TaxID=1808958 RepID=A0AAW0F0D1_9TRYP